MSIFVEKILLLLRDLPISVDTVREIEAPWPLLCSVFDQSRFFIQTNMNRVLSAVKPSIRPHDPYFSWLVKAIAERVWTSLEDTINLFLSSGVYPETLKDVVVRLLLKRDHYIFAISFDCAVPGQGGRVDIGSELGSRFLYWPLKPYIVREHCIYGTFVSLSKSIMLIWKQFPGNSWPKPIQMTLTRTRAFLALALTW